MFYEKYNIFIKIDLTQMDDICIIYTKELIKT